MERYVIKSTKIKSHLEFHRNLKSCIEYGNYFMVNVKEKHYNLFYFIFNYIFTKETSWYFLDHIFS